jgi:hypothetical protein
VLNKENAWEVVSLGLGAPALAATLWAISAGVSPHRLWPVAGFLFVWVATSGYVVLVKKAIRRRVLRLRSAPVPLGVCLVKPVWISLHEVATVVGMGAMTATVAAGVGFAGVGLGIQLAIGAISLTWIAPVYFRPRALTFELTGLRVHGRATQFLVPWTSVVDVGLTGSAQNQSANLQIVDPGHIATSVIPNSRQNRSRVQYLFELGHPRGRALSFGDWTAGLDAQTLVRFVREQTNGQLDRAN